MVKKWELVDRQDYKHQDTAMTDKYSECITHQLEKGSKVKLIFNTVEANSDTQCTELLWAEILLVQDDKYLGQLEDDPKQIKDLMRGEIVEFEERHIFESEYIDPFDSSIKV